MKNRKEYVVCDNDKGRIWRISKRLCRIKHGAGFRFVAKTLDLHIFKDRFYLKWSNIRETTSENRRVSFKIKSGRLVPYTKTNLGPNHLSYRSTYNPVLSLKDLKKGVNAKINRVLNKEYGLKFKIGAPFYKNVIRLAFPHYLDLYPDPEMLMAKVIKSPSVKKSIKSYCGFSGKKFLSELLAHSETTQRGKLDTVRLLRKHLTFGEIEVAKIKLLPKIEGLKKLIDLNPKFFKKCLMSDLPVDPIRTWENPFFHYFADTVVMYRQLARSIHLESTPLALSRAKNLKEYHDSLAIYYRKMKTENLPFSEYDFHGSQIGDFTIKVCKDSHELIEWSTYMENCVSSYRERILDGKIVMCGLFKEDKLIYNLSLRKVGKKFSIDQLNNRYNRGYDESDFALVETFVAEIKSVLPRQKKTVGIGCE